MTLLEFLLNALRMSCVSSWEFSSLQFPHHSLPDIKEFHPLHSSLILAMDSRGTLCKYLELVLCHMDSSCLQRPELQTSSLGLSDFIVLAVNHLLALVFWLENPHGWRSLLGNRQWGRKESDTTERLCTQHRCRYIMCKVWYWFLTSPARPMLNSTILNRFSLKIKI